MFSINKRDLAAFVEYANREIALKASFREAVKADRDPGVFD